MKALVKTEPGYGAKLVDVPVPKPGLGEVLVKIKAASICGTDVHIYTWDEWASSRFKPPMVFGHELAGEVVELGPGVVSPKPDQYVSAETHVVCNRCTQCLTGKAHVCRDYKIIGVDLPGCFAEYAVVPAANAWPTPPSLDPAVAALQEPLGNAVHTVFSGPVTAKSVLVTGCGPIGLLAVGAARAAGAAMVIASDPNPYRLNLAGHMGATTAVNPQGADLVAEVMAVTGGQGVDVVLEMSGAKSALADGLAAVKNGGRISILGIPSRPVELDMSSVVFKGVTLKGITGRAMFDTWFTAQGLLESGRLKVEPLITHRFKLDEYQQAFEVMISGNCGKVVMTP